MMKRHVNGLAGAALVAGMLLVAPPVTLRSDQAPPVNVPGIDKPIHS